jgi:outer membrane protein OmpA-like peptidoglycan-associated protein/opacity protein-like surface antigen
MSRAPVSRRTLAALTTCALSLAASGALAADAPSAAAGKTAKPKVMADPDWKGEIGIFGGVTLYGDDLALGNPYYEEDVLGPTGAFGLRGGALFKEKIGIEATLRFSPATFAALSNDEKTLVDNSIAAGNENYVRDDAAGAFVFGWSLAARYIFMSEQAFQPFVLGGFGLEHISTDNTYAINDADWLIHLGVGAQYKLSHRLKVRLDVRYMPGEGSPEGRQTASFDPNGQATFGDGSGASNNFAFNLGISYLLGGPPPDKDQDGIQDALDKCPKRAEDWDGFEDSDGCPEADNDEDGVMDVADKCPLKPEDKDGFEDGDGCPDLDNDKDGVGDADDKCPNQAEDKDGFQDDDGCPDNDNDGDGIKDKADKCPNKAEDRDGFEDGDGCPEADNDKDGIADKADKCPNEPETKNGIDDEDGCPDGLPPEAAKLVGVPLYDITFNKRGKLDVKKAQKTLEKVLEVALMYEALKFELVCHTDNRGKPDKLVEKSAARCEALKAWFVEQAIAEGRFKVTGKGGAEPIGDNATAAGRKQNERVEIKISQ